VRPVRSGMLSGESRKSLFSTESTTTITEPVELIWKYFYIKGASLIARRTSLRAANGIARTGYVHPGNQIRCGSDCKLEEEVSPYEDMPQELRKSQRSWYKGDYKEF